MSEEIQYLKYQRDEYRNFLNINYQIFLSIFSYQVIWIIIVFLNTQKVHYLMNFNIKKLKYWQLFLNQIHFFV